MYILRVFNGYGFDKFLLLDDPEWIWVDNRKEASELTIEWIQKNLGLILEKTNARRAEIIQVREHASHV